MYQMNKTVINQWLKGVGAFLLIFIDLNYILTTRFRRLGGNEKYEAILYLLLLISIIVLPILFGRILNRMGLILSKIINNWQLTSNSSNLEVLLSWCLSLVLNTIAIQKLFTQGTSDSLKFYMKPEMSKNTDALVNYFSNLNFLVLILVSLILTVIFFFLFHLSSILKSSKKLFIENVIFVGVLVTVTSIAWSLIYRDSSNYHLNVVLFPLAAINGNSPFIPLVSDGFTSLYGGYYLWLGLLSRLMGNSLLSIKTILCGLIAIQIILYYLITKAIYKNPLIRILVFISCIFWSYFYGKVVGKDIYFQYFPLRTLFPSMLIVILFYTSEIKFFDKVVFSIRFVTVTLRDFLLDFIVAIAILSNLDSGISVLIMYFFIYNWTYLTPEVFWSKQLIKQLIKFSINFILIILILVLSFRILAGSFINFSLLTASTSKFGAGFFGLPFPDNIWIIFMVFYGFNVVQSLHSSIEDTTAKYRFGIAIWGLISMFYFVNRSHPWNLINVSLPFFLSYGFFIEYAFNICFSTKEIFESEAELMQNEIDFTKFIKILLSNWFDLLKLSFLSVFIMPFIIISLIACVKFIPWTIYGLNIPKSYSQISALESLSQKVATLETQLNRPSILISDSLESYYYLLNHRKVLFYPEVASIFDLSFKPRFIKAINTFNPIVTVCQLNMVFEPRLYGTFVELLHENNYKVLESEGGCDVYISD